MKRYKSIDIVRGLAILIIILYHTYVLAGAPYEGLPISRYLLVGGEVGVTLFFIISGFGIHLSLSSDDEKGKLTYAGFLRRRVLRILPQYYVCCVVLLLFSSQAAFLSKDGLPTILSHALLLHNIWPSTSGTINGALWTMGTVFQFYLIAMLLYYAMKRRPVLTLALSLVVTIGSKYIIYHYFLAPAQVDSVIYFAYGRQLVTALDNFVVGMFLSWLLRRPRKESAHPRRPWLALLPLAVSVAAVIAWITPTDKYSYGAHFFAYIWHSGLALLLGAASTFSPCCPCASPLPPQDLCSLYQNISMAFICGTCP